MFQFSHKVQSTEYPITFRQQYFLHHFLRKIIRFMEELQRQKGQRHVPSTQLPLM